MSINKTTFAQVKYKIHEIGENAHLDWALILSLFLFVSILSFSFISLFYIEVQRVDKENISLENASTSVVSIDVVSLEKVTKTLEKRAEEYAFYDKAFSNISDPAR